MTSNKDAGVSPAAFGDGLCFGLTVPAALDVTTASRLMDRVRRRLRLEDAQPRLLEVDSAMLERHLGAPQMPEALAAAHEGFEAGMLPLEEEILQDELDLARHTLEARRREWRRSAKLAPLTDWRRLSTSDVLHLLVSWIPPALPVLDEDLGFACELAAAAGARTLIAPFGDGGRRSRLAALAGASGLQLALEPQPGRLAEATRCASGEPGFHALVVNAQATGDPGSGVLEQLAGLPRTCLPILRLHVAGRTRSDPGWPQQSLSDPCELLRIVRDLGRPVVVLFAVPGDRAGERDFSVAAVRELARAQACIRATTG